MNFSILFCLVVSLVAARHGVFAPKRVAVERCFAYPAADDPNFLHCLQNLICTPGPTFPNATTTATNATAPPAPPPTSSVSFPSPCSPDGACDCSQIEDKNGDEYFQCITNPACERCHWSTTASALPESTSTAPRTFTPGTYTVLVNGTTSVMVLPTQATVTLTKVVTPDATSEATPYEPTATACADCDCSLIADKQSEDYFECLTDPECESCRSQQQQQQFNRKKGFVRRM